MLQLQIADANISGGSVAVAWCLDHEVLNELAKKGVIDPQVIIVVAPTSNYHLSKESRKVVPLKDLMTYIECRASGKNKIYGLISMRQAKEAREHYLAKEDGAYRNNVLDYDGETYSSRLLGVEDEYDIEKKTYKYLSPPLEIEVPKGVFAPEPSAWEKNWVNHFFRQKVVDQCDFRRRRLFAYLVQPFIIGFFNLVRSVILLAGLLTGARNLSLKYLLHPLTYGLKDTFEIWEKGSLFIQHLPEDKAESTDLKFLTPSYAFRSFWALLFMPLFSLPIVWLLLRHHPVVAGLIAFVPIFFIVLLCLIAYLISRGNASRLLNKAWDGLNNLLTSDKLWYLDQEEVQFITCTNDKKPTTYKSLPARRKTIRLRFQNLKTKVCKPFSV
jgi:hypothetical protein